MGYPLELISWPTIREKLDQCQRGHNRCQDKAERRLPTEFRVIDVDKRGIVKIPDCSFVALSYVWGLDANTSMLKASRVTIADIMKEGGLNQSKIPQTIEDAMAVCTQLGFKYLWVDRLCIIQDDADDKSTQIEAMGRIYSSASVVLVVTFGDSMSFGIPGVSRPRELVQTSKDVCGLRITNVIREVESDAFAMWHTRGWTYQEAVLSHRRLYFTNRRVIFECEESVNHEDQFNMRTTFDHNFLDPNSHRLHAFKPGSAIFSFRHHIGRYTQRKLTYHSDVYNAFHGIMSSLYPHTKRILHGLPQEDFDCALLWWTDVSQSPSSPLITEEVVIPTWSWASSMGLAGNALYLDNNFFGSLVPWYTLETPPHSPVTTALNIVHAPSWLAKPWPVWMAIACHYSCFENISFLMSSAITDFSTIRHEFSARWADYHTFCKEAMTEAVNVTELIQPKTAYKAFTTSLGTGLLATRCQTTFQHLSFSPFSRSFEIRDSKGTWIGLLHGHVSPDSRYSASTAYEFMGLSLTSIYVMNVPEIAGKKLKAADQNRDSFGPLGTDYVPVVNVMMIGWRTEESGLMLAHRRELGFICLEDWGNLRREWKTTILE